MDALVMAAQLILGLSILVGVHELGHLVAAKVFGMRVEKYSIGFPPKVFGFKYGETEYSLGAIPLGGFVKISGMVDESLDTKQLSEEPQPWEFRAKPAWQRLIVMMGGIIVNVITGIIIFILLTFVYGDEYIPREAVLEHGIVAYDLGKEIGLQTGDKILKVNGREYKKFSELMGAEVLLENNSYFTIERNGVVQDIKIPNNLLNKLPDKNAENNFIDFRFPFEIGQLLKDTPAEKAGLEPGDKILSINAREIQYFDQIRDVVKDHVGEKVTLRVAKKAEEGEQPTIKTIPLQLKGDTIGFRPKPLINFAHDQFSFAESIPKGTKQAFTVVWVNIKAFGKIFRGEVSASKSLSGPIGIAQIFGGTWDWSNFWRITGLLSMVLAFMNFLPIPALDGGHVVFLTYEIVSGRKPSDKFLENAQKVGMVILLALMTFAIFNDFFKLLF